jgi:cytochrome P450
MSSILASDSAPVPGHVPPSLVRDFDMFDTRVTGELSDWWGRLHQEPDIFYTPRNGGHWVLTRYEDIAHAYDAFGDFSNTQKLTESRPFLMPPDEYDPPLHSDFRLLLAPFFTPKATRELGEKARRMTVELIEGFRAKGECEFIGDFAQMLPIGIFMDMVALPHSDRLLLVGLADAMTRGLTPEACAQGFQGLAEYLGRIIAERRANPGPDILSAVVHGRVGEGRELTETETLGVCMLLVIAGLDTVASVMGFIMIFLARNPGHRRQLIADPAAIPDAIEELLRRFSVVNLARTITHDFAYKGVELKAGDMVLLPTCLAAIDERRYEAPGQVDFARPDKKSLIFGRGPHLCLGAFLARTELRVFLEEWLKRIPDFDIKPGEAPQVVPGQVNSVQQLRLAWSI